MVKRLATGSSTVGASRRLLVPELPGSSSSNRPARCSATGVSYAAWREVHFPCTCTLTDSLRSPSSTAVRDCSRHWCYLPNDRPTPSAWVWAEPLCSCAPFLWLPFPCASFPLPVPVVRQLLVAVLVPDASLRAVRLRNAEAGRRFGWVQNAP